LTELVPFVSAGGLVILDDYWTWDGCTRAVHDYLSREQLPYRIFELGGGGAFRVW
jgi:O-methyltransferase